MQRTPQEEWDVEAPACTYCRQLTASCRLSTLCQITTRARRSIWISAGPVQSHLWELQNTFSKRLDHCMLRLLRRSRHRTSLSRLRRKARKRSTQLACYDTTSEASDLPVPHLSEPGRLVSKRQRPFGRVKSLAEFIMTP